MEFKRESTRSYETGFNEQQRRSMERVFRLIGGVAN